MTRDSASFDAALTRIRELFADHRQMPDALLYSVELEACTHNATRTAAAAGIPFVAACAEFGRAATESFPDDRLAAIRVGRTMIRWAATAYQAPSPLERASG